MKTLIDDRDARIVQLGELILVDWRGPVRIDAVDVLGAAIRSVTPARVALFIIIREACGVPSAPVRQHIKATMIASTDHIGAHATVIDGDGILASTMRTAINAMRVVVRKPYPERMFADVRTALEWLEQASPGPTWTAFDALSLLDPAPRSRRRA